MLHIIFNTDTVLSCSDQDDLDKSTQEAITTLNKHKDFMKRQAVVAEHHYKKRLELPSIISSKRDLTELSSDKNSKGKVDMQRRVSQADKNRKRKLKKKRAKEKRMKMNNDTS